MPRKDTKLCPHCGAKMQEHRHTLNAVLVEAMGKLWAHGREVNLRKLNLNRNEWDNFQKLKYWGFVYQVEVNGKRQRGVWWMTKRGVKFLCGEIEVRKTVRTYRGDVIAREGSWVAVDDLTDRVWEQRDDYAQKSQPH